MPPWISQWFLAKKLIFFKNNFTRINHCKFIHHKSNLKPFFSYLPCIVRWDYFSIIFNVKKYALYSINYSIYASNTDYQYWYRIVFTGAVISMSDFKARKFLQNCQWVHSGTSPVQIYGNYFVLFQELFLKIVVTIFVIFQELFHKIVLTILYFSGTIS